MVKRRVHVRLSDRVWADLDNAAQAPRVTQSAIVEEALRCYFDPDAKAGREAAILERLDAIDLRQGAVERDTAIILETLGQYVFYWLTRTDPLPEGERDIAHNLGRKRFDYFIEQVAGKIIGDDLLSARMRPDGTSHGEAWPKGES
ncbi:CopG family transcriptional regulator [Marinicaulis aureus]|uniref:CopG family transcriptional regulator n=1 Tax=Hyphococcus aureus TaxID=2666033 RepID=A0ABW1KWF5_9PROT